MNTTIIKIIFCSLFFIAATLGVYAQEFEITSFIEDPQDLSARTNQRLDNNGESCALVKIVMTIPDATFEGWIVGEVESKLNEYYVYIAPGSKKLTIKHSQFIPLTIKFEDFGIKQLQEKTTYVLRITKKTISEAFLDDYSQLKIGDYVYSDGTFSHSIEEGKDVIGILFTYQNTKQEKNRGWTHGQIVALQDCGEENEKFAWSTILADLNSPFINFPWKQGNGRNALIDDKNGYVFTNNGDAFGDEFPAFEAVRKYEVAFEQNIKNSGWYLPSAGQWVEILRNLGRVNVGPNLQFDKNAAFNNLQSINIKYGWYWTSSECDSKTAWIVRTNQGQLSNNAEKNKPFRIRAVISF